MACLLLLARAPAWADDRSGPAAARHQVSFHTGWVARDVEKWSGVEDQARRGLEYVWLPAGRRFGLEFRIAQDVKHVDAMPFLPLDMNDPWTEPQDARINTLSAVIRYQPPVAGASLTHYAGIGLSAMDAETDLYWRGRDYGGSAVGVTFCAGLQVPMGKLWFAGLDLRYDVARGTLKGRPYEAQDPELETNLGGRCIGLSVGTRW